MQRDLREPRRPVVCFFAIERLLRRDATTLRAARSRSRVPVCPPSRSISPAYSPRTTRFSAIEPETTSMATHVSLHDVTPFWAEELEAAIDLCAAVNARPALLVVPNFHGRAPLLDDEPFCRRLRELQAKGHEVFLHGYSHQSGQEFPGRGLAGWAAWHFAQRVASAGEAEMSGVTVDRARALVEKGEAVLREAGLRVDGFVAPAWSMPTGLLDHLSDRGCRFTEDHLRIYDPAGRRSRPSVVLNWATRSPPRLLTALAWCRAARPARTVIPVRIAIHPSDLHFLAVRREIERTLDWARGDLVNTAGDLFL